jgi:hypothetical protein
LISSGIWAEYPYSLDPKLLTDTGSHLLKLLDNWLSLVLW